MPHRWRPAIVGARCHTVSRFLRTTQPGCYLQVAGPDALINDGKKEGYCSIFTSVFPIVLPSRSTNIRLNRYPRKLELANP